jgi:hypothetical protein
MNKTKTATTKTATTKTAMNRIGYKWNINECLRLQREFELLGLTIDEIATKHKRTPKAIMFKLDEEGFATYTDLYNRYYGLNKFEIDHQTTTFGQLCGDIEEIVSSDSETETEDEDEDDDEDDAGGYYNMRNYIKKLETQVTSLLDYIKQNISQGDINIIGSNQC